MGHPAVCTARVVARTPRPCGSDRAPPKGRPALAPALVSSSRRTEKGLPAFQPCLLGGNLDAPPQTKIYRLHGKEPSGRCCRRHGAVLWRDGGGGLRW